MPDRKKPNESRRLPFYIPWHKAAHDKLAVAALWAEACGGRQSAWQGGAGRGSAAPLCVAQALAAHALRQSTPEVSPPQPSP